MCLDSQLGYMPHRQQLHCFLLKLLAGLCEHVDAVKQHRYSYLRSLRCCNWDLNLNWNAITLYTANSQRIARSGIQSRTWLTKHSKAKLSRIYSMSLKPLMLKQNLIEFYSTAESLARLLKSAQSKKRNF